MKQRTKKIFLLFLILYFAGFAKAQNSNIYNNQGLLYVDTLLSIPPNCLGYFIKIEKNVLPKIYSWIRYPKVCADNDIEGEVIVRVEKLNRGRIQFKIEKSVEYFLSKEILRVLGYYQKEIENYSTNIKSNFFIPFKFKLLNSSFEKNLKKNKAFTIEGLKERKIEGICGFEE